MTIIDAALSRSRTVIALLTLILIAGFSAYVNIPKEARPDVNIPIIYVSMSLKGISPEDAERLLVRPMESELKSIEGIKEMRSSAYLGGANVLLEFEAGFNADQALNDVRERADIAEADLPEDAEEPRVEEVNLSLFPIIIVTLGGEVPERTLLKIGRDLQEKVKGISAVLEANIGGDRDEQVEIVIDPLLLDSYGLDPRRVLDA
ncbi:MAG TPA: MFS transporter, partial [Rhodospirillaceae bacterium]|nr:MFS transporter [Rhodospirillaceae bacterium]